MTTDKFMIAGWFTEAEEKLLIKYADKHRMTKAEAIEALVKKVLLQDDEPPKKTPRLQIVTEKVERLEKTLDNWITTVLRTMECNEKIGKQIAYLQDEIEFLERKVKDEACKAE